LYAVVAVAEVDIRHLQELIEDTPAEQVAVVLDVKLIFN
jgi:hypothetical protein